MSTPTPTPTQAAPEPEADAELTPVRVADHLEQDPAIRGQRFACISFVSPSDAIKAKDAYVTRRYLSALAADVRSTLENVEAIFSEHKTVAAMMRMLRGKHSYLWDETAAQSEFALFREQESERLERDFRAEHGNFKTNVHGFKIRGVYDSVEEATERAKSIKKFDDKFNVFVAEVGCWCPWSPSTSEIKDVEYGETQLNTLMKKYDEAQDAKAEVYENRKKDLVAEMDAERAEMQKQIQAEIFEHKEESRKKAEAAEAAAEAAAAEAAAETAEAAGTAETAETAVTAVTAVTAEAAEATTDATMSVEDVLTYPDVDV